MKIKVYVLEFDGSNWANNHRYTVDSIEHAIALADRRPNRQFSFETVGAESAEESEAAMAAVATWR